MLYIFVHLIAEKSTNDIRNTCFNSNNISSLPTTTINTLLASLPTMGSFQQNAEELRQIQQQQQDNLQLATPISLDQSEVKYVSFTEILDPSKPPSNFLNDEEQSINFSNIIQDLLKENNNEITILEDFFDVKNQLVRMDTTDIDSPIPMTPTDDENDRKPQFYINLIECQQQQLQPREITSNNNYNSNNYNKDEQYLNHCNGVFGGEGGDNNNNNINIKYNNQQDNSNINQNISGGNKRQIETNTDNKKRVKKNHSDLKLNTGICANNSEGEIQTPQIITDVLNLEEATLFPGFSPVSTQIAKIRL